MIAYYKKNSILMMINKKLISKCQSDYVTEVRRQEL